MTNQRINAVNGRVVEFGVQGSHGKHLSIKNQV